MDYTPVLKKIRPSAAEEKRVAAFVEKLLAATRKITKKGCVICGSIGKGTWLAGNHDVDLFILFSPDVPRATLEKEGLALGNKIAQTMKGTARVKYAEHPYTQAAIGGFVVDIVPAYQITKGETIISAVDRSPLHLAYIRSHLSPEQRDDARLLKQWCKGIGVYGSDAKTEGFSGYVCELLILRYGSFAKVTSEAATWQPGHVVSDGTHRLSSVRQPLVVIDPTDLQRNAAAVVSGRQFTRFAAAARRFRENPSGAFFFPPPPQPLSPKELATLQKRQTYVSVLTMKKPDVIDDILYPQLRKTEKRIDALLRHHEFAPLRIAAFVTKNVYLFIELDVWSLPRIKKMIGPPLFARVHVNEFVSKYANISRDGGFGPYIEDDRWIVGKQREFMHVRDLMASLKKRDLSALGIPSTIAPVMKSAAFVEGMKAWVIARKDKELSTHLRKMYYGTAN